jgi:DNA-binding PadR family transcriptional regulator
MAEVLGTFEQAVLLAIVHLGADAYGRAILHQVQTSLRRNISAGSVYTTLDRLEARALIASSLADGTPARGGRPRRYYKVAAEGVRALDEAHQIMTALWKSVKWPTNARKVAL